LGQPKSAALVERSNTSAPDTTFAMTMPLTHRRRGRQMKLTVNGHEPRTAPDPSLVTAIVRAWDWADRLLTGKVATMAEICAAEGFSDTYVGQLLPLAFLDPIVVEDILDGRQDPALTADRMIWEAQMPVVWERQAILASREPI
jgi:hypothetical protein